VEVEAGLLVFCREDAEGRERECGRDGEGFEHPGEGHGVV